MQVLLASCRLSKEVLAKHQQERGSVTQEQHTADQPNTEEDWVSSQGTTAAECPVPELAIAISAAVSCLGCRVLVRRVTDSKQYWSKGTGCTYAICVMPSTHRPSLASVAAAGFKVSEPPPAAVGTGLVIDPNFKAKFTTPIMTSRYR